MLQKKWFCIAGAITLGRIHLWLIRDEIKPGEWIDRRYNVVLKWNGQNLYLAQNKNHNGTLKICEIVLPLIIKKKKQKGDRKKYIDPWISFCLIEDIFVFKSIRDPVIQSIHIVICVISLKCSLIIGKFHEQ